MRDVLFRSLLNQCRTVYSYEKVRRKDNSMGFAAEELEAGAVSICKALGGEYKDLDGSKKKVHGDLAKLKNSTALTDAGRRLLQNLEHSSRQLRGAMEVREIMRFETHAGRIRRGVPIFVTWSPDEKHDVLMIRMHRARANDPIHKLDRKLQRFGQRLQPAMGQDYVTIAMPAKDMGKCCRITTIVEPSWLGTDSQASMDSGLAFCSYVSFCGDCEFAPCARIATVEMQTMAARISSEATLSPKVAS
jgi:hypothetical protein